MTGLAVAVVAIVSFTHNATTVALACVVVGVATLELASSLRKRGLRPATLVALVNYLRRGVPATWELAEGPR